MHITLLDYPPAKKQKGNLVRINEQTTVKRSFQTPYRQPRRYALKGIVNIAKGQADNKKAVCHYNLCRIRKRYEQTKQNKTKQNKTKQQKKRLHQATSFKKISQTAILSQPWDREKSQRYFLCWQNHHI